MREELKEEIDIVYIINLLWRGRKIIMISSGVFVLLAIIYSFFATPLYRSWITLYPAQEDNSLSPMTTIARQLGVGSQDYGENFNIPDVVKSRSLSEQIILKEWEISGFEKPVNLIEYFNRKFGAETDPDLTEAEIASVNEYRLNNYSKYMSAKRIDVSFDEETGLITAYVDMEDPALSKDIANFISSFVTNMVNQRQKESIKQNLEFINERVNILYHELQLAENDLKNFRETNRNILNSPDLQLELQRLQRIVTVKQEVYLTLIKQKELNQIEENKKIDAVRLLDNAILPVKPYKPSYIKNIVKFFAGGFILSVLFLLFTGFIDNNKNNLEIPEKILRIFKKP